MGGDSIGEAGRSWLPDPPTRATAPACSPQIDLMPSKEVERCSANDANTYWRSIERLWRNSGQFAIGKRLIKTLRGRIPKLVELSLQPRVLVWTCRSMWR